MPSQYEDLARGALLEITPASTVGAFASETDEGDGVVSVLFDSAQPGYPDWKWTVSIAHVEGQEPTVLEVELMPGEGAMLAPDWVPWSDRLAEYKAAQEALGLEADAAALEAADDIDDDDDDDSDDDTDGDEDDDEDDFGSDVLHGGDLDGVDIDDLDDEQEKTY
ncbi:MAG: DUF3027 domain-containing protein [Rhodoglobus sp.]